MKFFEKSRLKIKTENNKIFMTLSLKNKDRIADEQLKTLMSGEYPEFAKGIWIKDKSGNKITYELDALTPLSRYISSGISQENYISLINQIYKVFKICSENNIPVQNIIWDLKYSFCNPANQQLCLICIPVTGDDYTSKAVKWFAEFHRKIQITVSEPVSFSAYHQFIEDCIDQCRKNKTDINKNLLASFFENKTELLVKENITKKHTVKNENISPSGNCNIPSAYITDERGMKYYIDHLPFFIGRNGRSDGIDLSLPDIPEISGCHAKIIFEGGKFFIEDCNSTNGTYIRNSAENNSGKFPENQIKKCELCNNSEFLLYHTSFHFFMEENSTQTCLISYDDYENSRTQYLDETDNENNYIAYIASADDGVLSYIYAFPFTSEKFEGIKIEHSKREFLLTNISQSTLSSSEEAVPFGHSVTLFSGCSFCINKNEYTFYIRN